MMKRTNKKERRGLPGGPNEQFTYVTGVFQQDMYHVPKAQKGWEPGSSEAYNDSLNLYKAMIMQDKLMGNKARNLTGEEKEEDFYKERGWGYDGEGYGGRGVFDGYTPLDYFDPGSIELDINLGDSYKSQDEMFNNPNHRDFWNMLHDAKDETKSLLDYYKSLGFTDDNIMYHDSPDVVHPNIRPIDYYYDGRGYSPVYKKPSKKKLQPSYRLVDYMNINKMDSSKENRRKLALEHGIEGYDFSAEKNTELLKALNNPPTYEDYQGPIEEEPEDYGKTIKFPRVVRQHGFSETSLKEHIERQDSLDEREDQIRKRLGLEGMKKYGGKVPKAQSGLSHRDSVAKQANKTIYYDMERGRIDGEGLPYYSDPKYMDILMDDIFPEVSKIMPKASAMEKGEAMDFIFNAGWNKDTKKIKKDPRGYALQEYYKKYDPSKLNAAGEWEGRKGAPYSFDEEYANTIGKLSENKRRVLMNLGRDWYYQRTAPINSTWDLKTQGPHPGYENTWYGRIGNMNTFEDFNPNWWKKGHSEFRGKYYNHPNKRKYGGKVSTEGYKRYSKDVNKPQNIIEGDQYYGTPITMGDVDFPVVGVDNLGNKKIMYPEEEHHFPGDMVYETPLRKAQKGIDFNEWYDTVPKEKSDTTLINLKRAYELAPKKDLDDFIKIPNAHLYTAYPHKGGYEFIKKGKAAEKELDWYYSDEGADFRNEYDLDTSGEYNKYIPRIPKAQDGKSVMFKPYANIFPINEEIKANVVMGGVKTHFKDKPVYLNTSIESLLGYVPNGPNIFDLKGKASVGMKAGNFNTELGVSKNFMRGDDPSLTGSIGYNTPKFGIKASSNIPTKKNSNFSPKINFRYNPNENFSVFGEGQYDSITKSPSFRAGLNYRFQDGGSYNFDNLVNRYKTKGWNSLNPQEQQFYRETYQRGGSLPKAQKGIKDNYSWMEPLLDTIENYSGVVPENIKNNVLPLGNNTYEATPWSLPVAEVWGNPINTGRQLLQNIGEGTGYVADQILQGMATPEALAAFGIDKLKGKDTKLADAFPSVFSDIAGRQHKGQPDVVSSATSDDWVMNNKVKAAGLSFLIPGGFGSKVNKGKKLAKQAEDLLAGEDLPKMLNDLQDFRKNWDKDLDDIWDVGANESMGAISKKYNKLNQRGIDNRLLENTDYQNLLHSDKEWKSLHNELDGAIRSRDYKRDQGVYNRGTSWQNTIIEAEEELDDKIINAIRKKLLEREKKLLIKEGYDPKMTLEQVEAIKDKKLSSYYDLGKNPDSGAVWDLNKKKYVADPTYKPWWQKTQKEQERNIMDKAYERWASPDDPNTGKTKKYFQMNRIGDDMPDEDFEEWINYMKNLQQGGALPKAQSGYHPGYHPGYSSFHHWVNDQLGLKPTLSEEKRRFEVDLLNVQKNSLQTSFPEEHVRDKLTVEELSDLWDSYGLTEDQKELEAQRLAEEQYNGIYEGEVRKKSSNQTSLSGMSPTHSLNRKKQQDINISAHKKKALEKFKQQQWKQQWNQRYDNLVLKKEREQFQKLVDKYTTQGWDSLSETEQDFYRENRKFNLPIQNKFSIDSDGIYSGIIPTIGVTASPLDYNPVTGENNPVRRYMREGRNKLSKEVSTAVKEGVKTATGWAAAERIGKNPKGTYEGVKGVLEAGISLPGSMVNQLGEWVLSGDTDFSLGRTKFGKTYPESLKGSPQALDAFELIPPVGLGAKLVSKGLKFNKAFSRKSMKDLGAFPGAHTPAFYQQSPKTMTKAEKHDRNFGDLKYAQQWAKKYGYNFPENLEDVIKSNRKAEDAITLENVAKSDELTDIVIKEVVDKHNTFIRGVSTNWEKLKDQIGEKEWSNLIKIFKKENIDHINDPRAAAEYMATHIPKVDTRGGRVSLNNLNRELDALYSSNSKGTGEGYTYGQGFIVDVKRPTNFSSSDRRNWIKNNELDYFEHGLPNSNSDLSKRILKTEHTLGLNTLEDLYNDKIMLKNVWDPLYESRSRADVVMSNLRNQGKFKNLTEENAMHDAFSKTYSKRSKLNKFLNRLSTPAAHHLVRRNDLKRANEAALKQMELLTAKFPDWKNIKGTPGFQGGWAKNYFDPEKYAHYIHMGRPGEKIFDAVKFEQITPENWFNTSRGHAGKYTKGFSAGSIIGGVGTAGLLNQQQGYIKGGELDKYQVRGETQFQKLVDKYKSKGWDSLTPQDIRIIQEEMPHQQNNGYITYESNPEYFDSQAFLSGVGNSPSSIKWSDQIKKKVYAGTHGYNPSTGALTKLDSPQGGATGLDLAYSKREEDRTPDEKAIIKKQIEPKLHQLRRDRAFKDLQNFYRGPGLIPGLIATAGTIGPAALANPYVQAGLTGYGVYDATTHSIPGAVKATKEGRYLDAAGNTAMASLDLLPIPFFGTNLIEEAKGLKWGVGNIINNIRNKRTIESVRKSIKNVYDANYSGSAVLSSDYNDYLKYIRSRVELPISQHPATLEEELFNVDIRNINIKDRVNNFRNYTPDINLNNEQIEAIISNPQFLDDIFVTAPLPSVVNRSGFTKTEVLSKGSKKTKDDIDKMSDKDFQTSYVNPKGELKKKPTRKEIDEIFAKNPVEKISNQEYEDEFNSGLDLLNDIIEKNRNPNSPPYEITGLKGSGLYIKSEFGTSFFTVDIKPGRWKGEIQDMPSKYYVDKVPGLNMYNTTKTLWGDIDPFDATAKALALKERKGSRVYDSLNEYLKKMNLGRVKSGFSGQSNYALPLWEKAVKKDKAIGWYRDPGEVGAIYKSLFPAAIATGTTKALLNQQEEYAKGGSINLDPAKKGTFKALATRYGMSMGKLAMDMKKNPNKYSPGARKKANFYRNFVMQQGGSTSSLWEEKTGLPWSEAKVRGLSDGTRATNMILREKLLNDEINFSDAPVVNNTQPVTTPQVKQEEVNFDQYEFNEAFGRARKMYGSNKIFKYKGHLKTTNRRGEPFEPSAEELAKWKMNTKKTKKNIKKQNDIIISPYTSQDDFNTAAISTSTDFEERVKEDISITPKPITKDEYLQQTGNEELEYWDDIKNRQRDVNKMDNANVVVNYQKNKAKSDYIVIDKSKGLMHLYHPKETKSYATYPVDIGSNFGDGQTVTKPKDLNNDGRITDADKRNNKFIADWDAGNLTTGAGKFYISNILEKGLDGLPLFNMMNERQYENYKKTGDVKSVSTSFHTGYIKDDKKRVSHGCIRCNKATLDVLMKNISSLSQVFILPEEKQNKFYIKDDKLYFKNRNRNKYFKYKDGKRIYKKANDKWYISDSKNKKFSLLKNHGGMYNELDKEAVDLQYNVYEDENGIIRKGQGINRTPGNKNYKPIKIDIDKNSFIKDKDQRRYEEIVLPYTEALEDHKKKIMDKFNITSDEYNDLVPIAMGILGNETAFGDEHSSVGDLTRAINKGFGKAFGYSASSPDYKSKYSTYGANKDHHSVGLTQLRWKMMEEGNLIKKMNELGVVHNSDLLRPEKAAVATIARLAFFLKNREYNKSLDFIETIPRFWGGSSKDDHATYTTGVKNNSKYFQVLQYKQEGGEVKALYKEYIDGKNDSSFAEKAYDKLNRIYYKDAKQVGMSPPNYIMTHIIGNV